VKRAWVLIAVIAAVVVTVVFVAGRRQLSEPPREVDRPNIILITIDTLRADRLGRGLTPNIDALARAGARFENARTTSPLTLPSHVTMMTGMTPPQHSVRQNGVVFKPQAPTLARVLRDEGYQTAAFVGAYVLNRRFGLADGFDVYDDRVPRNPDLGARLEAERPGAAVADAALGWLTTAQEPFFAWVHFYDPHAPYMPPQEFAAKAGGNAYDAEVAYADAQVGRVLEALRQRGFDQRSIIAVAGDHGEGLGEHGEQTHGMLTYDSTLRVPLVLTARGVSPLSVRNPVSLIDLAGTLLNLAQVRHADGMSGQSLLSKTSTDRDVYAETEYPRTAGWHPIAALAEKRWKLVLSSEPELYDLQADPGETRNVATSMASLVEGMSKRIRELSRPGREPASAVPPDAAERLRALGYVSGGSSRTVSANAPNPARVIASWNAFERALSQLNRGETLEALKVLETLIERHGESPVFYSIYARALARSRSSKTAGVSILREAVKRWPDDATLYHDLAVQAWAAGEAAEAMRAEQAALALDPQYPEALNGLGLLHADAGRHADAAAAFDRAAKGDPSNASYWTNLGNARRELGDVAGADAAYRRALEADPKYADALNGIGVLLVQQRRPADAVAWFERALQHAPDMHEARLNLGIAYQESGQREKAAATYRELLDKTPPDFKRERQAAAELLRSLK
jgi:arylsulfatase A-like enzyme/Flp pilus assembly protein TadD